MSDNTPQSGPARENAQSMDAATAAFAALDELEAQKQSYEGEGECAEDGCLESRRPTFNDGGTISSQIYSLLPNLTKAQPVCAVTESNLAQGGEDGCLESRHLTFTANPGDAAFKSGFVSIIGRPNAGKSTLINALVGHKVAIVSNTAQTTRTRIRAVVTRPDFQIVFCDTPGIHKPKDVLGEELNAAALRALEDNDAICMAIDLSSPIGRGDAWVASQIKHLNTPKICILTKRDLVGENRLRAQFEAARELAAWDAIVALSAKTGYNLDALLEEIAVHLPKGPAWFPPDMDTDQTDEMLVAELIREKILRQTFDEVPHSVGVVCDYLDYSKRKNLFSIQATIYVERDSQKAMIIGRKGAMIKKIGTQARAELEQIFDSRIYLDLNVKTKRGWRSDEAQLLRMGYIEG